MGRRKGSVPTTAIRVATEGDCGYVDNSGEMSAEEYNALMTKETASKYGNKKTVVDGITFDSAKEANRYRELKLLEQAGEIEDLSVQHRLPCNVNGSLVCTYIADFRYTDLSGRHRKRVYEDVKGYRTDVYRLKKRLVEALYDITITEV